MALWEEREKTSGCFLARKRHFPLIWTFLQFKLITYSGSRALRQPDSERSLKKHYLKAIKNAREKNSIQLWQNIRYNPSPPFNNPHTYPLSQPPCLTLQPTTPLMIPNSQKSSKRVLTRRGTQTRVSPPPRPPFFFWPSPRLPCSAVIDDETRRCVLTLRLVPLPGLAPTPAKRGRGRPKGSKNKKSGAGTAASTSEDAPAAGEKRKRGRPPKVRSAELFPKCSSNLRDCAAQECPGGGCVG